MNRDWRLLASALLLIASAIAAIKHSALSNEWLLAWASHDEKTIQERFGVIPPEGCAFDCYGWGAYPGDWYQYGATIGFVVALVLIFWVWLKPNK